MWGWGGFCGEMCRNSYRIFRFYNKSFTFHPKSHTQDPPIWCKDRTHLAFVWESLGGGNGGGGDRSDEDTEDSDSGSTRDAVSHETPPPARPREQLGVL